MIIGCVSAALITLVIVVLFVRDHKRRRDGTWHPYNQHEMRRLVDGAWEFRPMTEAEYQEEQSKRAW